jgi:hypothetical protein
MIVFLIKRFRTLQGIVKIAFISSFVSILTIELILKNYSAPSRILFILGDIYLKLCFSICAGIIFYFINQHLPKEKKKIKSYAYINNKLCKINKEIEYFIENLEIVKDPNHHYLDLKLEDINAACLKINPQKYKVSGFETGYNFKNWFEYFNYKYCKIIGLIKDLQIINDSIDIELMAKILEIEEILSHYFHPENKKIGSKEMSFWSRPLYELNISGIQLHQIFWKNYTIYQKESRKYNVRENLLYRIMYNKNTPKNKISSSESIWTSKSIC